MGVVIERFVKNILVTSESSCTSLKVSGGGRFVYGASESLRGQTRVLFVTCAVRSSGITGGGGYPGLVSREKALASARSLQEKPTNPTTTTAKIVQIAVRS